MAKYNDLLNTFRGTSLNKENSQDKHDGQLIVPGTDIAVGEGVSTQSYHPFEEETEMLGFEDAGEEDGSGNLTNTEFGATTGNPSNPDEDQQLKLKLQALKRIR